MRNYNDYEAMIHDFYALARKGYEPERVNEFDGTYTIYSEGFDEI